MKSKINQRIFQSMKRIGVCLLILVFFASIMAIRGTNAGFSDVEESGGNTFSAASLDGEATYIDYFSVVGMKPGQKPNHRITFSNVGVLDFRYGIKVRKTGGDDTLCNAFLLTAERNGVKVYDKLLLKDFDINQFPLGSPFEISRFGGDDWDFTVELPADAGSALEDKTCQWNFDFTAWQTDMPDATQGFSDVESVGTHSIATGEWLTPGDVVINEVMWMGSTASSADEWIELKNMTGSAISLAGWKIENAGPSNGTITLPTGAFIPANGYYLIANDHKSDTNSALNVEADDVVNLGLNNTENGNLVLKNNTTPALVIDSALGTPNWGAGNHGTLEQSMERNDVPGDGLLAASWHACVSGAANGSPYWDATGNNYGTPKAANLSPIVMNEIMFNPSGENKEWTELYNISDKDIDVSGWYFKNSQGDKTVISQANSDNNGNLDDEGETNVPAGGRLLVYFAKGYFSNGKDEVSLYNDAGTPDDEKDDVREDVYQYEKADIFPADKTFSRIPDGVGIWIDPEATPGEENKLDKKETAGFQLLAYDKCFDGEKIKKKSQDEICAPAFLQYLNMIKELDDKKIKDSTLLDILETLRQEEAKKLTALLAETAAMTAGKLPTTAAPEEGSGTAKTAGDQTVSGETPPAEVPVSGETGANGSANTPLEVVPPEEPAQSLPNATAETPKETKAPDAPPADVPKEASSEPNALSPIQ